MAFQQYRLRLSCSLVSLLLLLLCNCWPARSSSSNSGGGGSDYFLLEDFTDYRCKCVCPRSFHFAPPVAAANTSLTPQIFALAESSAKQQQQQQQQQKQRRRIWVAKVRPGEKCACEATVAASAASAAAASAAAQLADYCRRCKCQAESRNSAVQKVVIISLLVTIGGLCLYMLLLFLLWTSSTRTWLRTLCQHLFTSPSGYEQEGLSREGHSVADRDDANPSSASASADGAEWSGVRIRSTSDAVVNRARAKQAEWSRSVAAQRDRVYRHRSMLQ